MNLIFVCPISGKPFESDDFTIIENKGVKTDASGNKMLDAKVSVSCPFCGYLHVFHAAELTCPFTG